MINDYIGNWPDVWCELAYGYETLDEAFERGWIHIQEASNYWHYVIVSKEFAVKGNSVTFLFPVGKFIIRFSDIGSPYACFDMETKEYIFTLVYSRGDNFKWEVIYAPVEFK